MRVLVTQIASDRKPLCEGFQLTIQALHENVCVQLPETVPEVDITALPSYVREHLLGALLVADAQVPR